MTRSIRHPSRRPPSSPSPSPLAACGCGSDDDNDTEDRQPAGRRRNVGRCASGYSQLKTTVEDLASDPARHDGDARTRSRRSWTSSATRPRRSRRPQQADAAVSDGPGAAAIGAMNQKADALRASLTDAKADAQESWARRSPRPRPSSTRRTTRSPARSTRSARPADGPTTAATVPPRAERGAAIPPPKGVHDVRRTAPTRPHDVTAEVAALSDGATTLFVADFDDTETAWEAYEALQSPRTAATSASTASSSSNRDADGKLEIQKATDHSTQPRAEVGPGRRRRPRARLPAVDHRQCSRAGRCGRRHRQGPPAARPDRARGGAGTPSPPATPASSPSCPTRAPSRSARRSARPTASSSRRWTTSWPRTSRRWPRRPIRSDRPRGLPTRRHGERGIAEVGDQRPRVTPWRRPSTAAGGSAPRTARTRPPSSWVRRADRLGRRRAGADPRRRRRRRRGPRRRPRAAGLRRRPRAPVAHRHGPARASTSRGTTSVAEALRAIEDAVRRRGGRPVFALNWQEHDWAEDRADDRGRARPGQLRRRGLRVAHRRALGRGLQRPGHDLAGPTGSTAGWATGSSPATPRTPPAPPSTPPAAPTSAARTSRTPSRRGRGRGHRGRARVRRAAAHLRRRLRRRPRARAPPRPAPHRRLLGRGGHRPRAGPRPCSRCTAPPASAATSTSTARSARTPPTCARPTPTTPGAAARHTGRAPTCATTSRPAPWPASRAGSTSSATPGWTPSSRATRPPPSSSGLDVVRATRPRLEHAEMVDADGHRPDGAAGMVASVQPAFDAFWGGAAGMYEARLGRSGCRAPTRSPRWRRAGVRLALGSDSPVTPFDPWAAVRAAVEHHEPDQRLDVATAARRAHRGRPRGGPRGRGRGAPGRRAGDLRGVGRRRNRATTACPRCARDAPCRPAGSPCATAWCSRRRC